MNCKKATRLLPSYVGGDLDRRHKLALKSHIAECESCARELASYEDALSALAALQPDRDVREHTRDYWEDIRNRALVTPHRSAASGPSPTAWSLPRFALAAAVLLALGIGAGFLGHRFVERQIARQIAKLSPAPLPEPAAVSHLDGALEEHVVEGDALAAASRGKRDDEDLDKEEPVRRGDPLPSQPARTATTYHIGEATVIPVSHGSRSY